MSAVVEFGHRTQIVARLKHALLAFWVPLVLAALVPTIVTVVASRFDGPVSKPLPSLLPPNDILSPPAVPVETTPLAAQQPLATLDGMFWDSIKTSNNPADFKAYLTRFPNGMFVELAQNRLAILERDTVPSPKPLSDGLASGSSVWPDRDETAGMIERALALIIVGDILAARIILRRAYERGDERAALALGETYDPLIVKRLNKSLADAGQARDWYRRAAGLGSVAAIYRLTELGLQDH
jgi:hypothetical protein